MTLYLKQGGNAVPWTGQVIAGVQHPLDIEALWTDAELSGIGLFKPLDPDPIPEGKIEVSRSVELVYGAVKWVIAYEDAPAPPPPAPITPDQVWAEKDRRWAFGFQYDFGDTRGVHRIATTPKDLEDWQKVTSIAGALVTLSQVTSNSALLATPIGIYTETGETTVTPIEWQQVLVAAAAFFQPTLDAAVALVATDPIPLDYTDDKHWVAAPPESGS